jgi:hypothetical protein
VKDRCELSGMRWLQSGAENLLRLRAVAENNDWDDYHAYRKKRNTAKVANSLKRRGSQGILQLDHEARSRR